VDWADFSVVVQKSKKAVLKGVASVPISLKLSSESYAEEASVPKGQGRL
jgi:hypothetical protein